MTEPPTPLEREIIACLSMGGETTTLLLDMLDDEFRALINTPEDLDRQLEDMAGRGLVTSELGPPETGSADPSVRWWSAAPLVR